MSIETTYACDVCGEIRGESNHWFEVVEHAGNIALAKFLGRRTARQVCGSKCAHALLDRWLTTGNLESKQETAKA